MTINTALEAGTDPVQTIINDTNTKLEYRAASLSELAAKIQEAQRTLTLAERELRNRGYTEHYVPCDLTDGYRALVHPNWVEQFNKVYEAFYCWGPVEAPPEAIIHVL